MADCNHHLTVTPKQETAARVLPGTKRSDLIPILNSLHWLSVSNIIEYTEVLLVLKSIHAPTCITDMFKEHTRARPRVMGQWAACGVQFQS